MASLTISWIREQAIDFTKPFMNLGISILFKRPKRESPGLFSFLNPLAIEIWLYVIAAYFVVGLIMFIIARLRCVATNDMFITFSIMLCCNLAV